jgi:hypothetical protein
MLTCPHFIVQFILYLTRLFVLQTSKRQLSATEKLNNSLHGNLAHPIPTLTILNSTQI